MTPFKNSNDNWQVNLESLELVSENSFATTNLGSYTSTMELFTSKGGVPELIEWDIPELEETEHIGLSFDGKILTDYDGVFSFPAQAREFLESLGFNCDYADDSKTECYGCDTYFSNGVMIDGVYCSETCKEKYKSKYR